MLWQILAFLAALALVIAVFLFDAPVKKAHYHGPLSIQSGEQLDWALAHGMNCNRVANQYTCY